MRNATYVVGGHGIQRGDDGVRSRARKRSPAPGIDLDALLDRLADEAEMRAVLEALPDGWPLVKRLPW